MSSVMNATCTQSSVVRKRSSMSWSRATILGRRATTRPQPRLRVLCTIASKRRTRSPLVYALSVRLRDSQCPVHTGGRAPLQGEVFADRVPVLDHMWQTETGGPIIANPYGISMLPTKPGSGGIPVPGVQVGIISPDGTFCGPNEKGIFVIKRPFPGLTSTLWGDPDRYTRDYWERVPGQTLYFSGDAAEIDDDGYL